MCFWSLTRVTALLGAWLMYSSSAGSPPTPERLRTTMVSLADTDNGRTVNVHLGDTVQVALRENATTGYRWAIDRYDEEFIEAIGSESHYAPDTKNSVGVGGTVAFIFRGKKAGTGEVVLKNWRHWEGDKSITSRFRFQSPCTAVARRLPDITACDQQRITAWRSPASPPASRCRGGRSRPASGCGRPPHRHAPAPAPPSCRARRR